MKGRDSPRLRPIAKLTRRYAERLLEFAAQMQPAGIADLGGYLLQSHVRSQQMLLRFLYPDPIQKFGKAPPRTPAEQGRKVTAIKADRLSNGGTGDRPVIMLVDIR